MQLSFRTPPPPQRKKQSDGFYLPQIRINVDEMFDLHLVYFLSRAILLKKFN
jgi:hypothetical protein